MRDNRRRAKIKRAFLKEAAIANPKAIKAIKQADLILIGPGDLYTSIIPNLLVNNIATALQESSAKKIYVLNLMTKYGQTTNYTAADHVEDLKKYLEEKTIDTILVNKTKPTEETLAWYTDFGEELVTDNLSENNEYKLERADLIKDVVLEKEASDTLKRSIIRHDSAKLAAAIMNLL